MNIPTTLLAALIYPGLLTAVVAGALFGLLSAGALRRPAPGGLRGREGLAALASVLFAGLGLAALPWPAHPLPAGDRAAWLWAWAGFELAFLTPLAPALAAGAPAVVRAAAREAQLGALARAAIWGALAPALALQVDWRAATAPAHLLALAVAAFALPAAIGWGPFAAEERVTPGGTQGGLPEPQRAADAWARDVRSGALVAAVMVAGLPSASGPPWLGALVVLGGVLVALLALRRMAGRLPRVALPTALRLYALWALPGAALAALALALAERL